MSCFRGGVASRRARGAGLFALLGLVAPGAFAQAPAPVTAPPPTAEACIEHHRRAQAELRRGRLLASGNELRSCLTPECSPVLREACAALLNEVDRDTPSVVFAAEAAHRDVVAVAVFDSDLQVASALDGGALALDPGEHHFRFEAPGMAVATMVVVLRVGDHNRRVAVSLAPAELAPSRRPGSAPVPPPPVASPVGATAHSYTLDYALLGAGAALGITGLAFGLSANSDYKNAEATCAPTCSESRQSRIRQKSLAADGLFVLSAAATAYGLIRLFSVGKGPEKATVSAGVGSLVAEGSF